eukprot:4336399-Prymnesium_polylepis.1
MTRQASCAGLPAWKHECTRLITLSLGINSHTPSDASTRADGGARRSGRGVTARACRRGAAARIWAGRRRARGRPSGGDTSTRMEWLTIVGVAITPRSLVSRSPNVRAMQSPGLRACKGVGCWSLGRGGLVVGVRVVTRPMSGCGGGVVGGAHPRRKLASR